MTTAAYLHSQISLMQYLDFFGRILLACICGACIGFERTRRLKEAGIRTHIIVCFAAAVMMIVSKYGFMDVTALESAALGGTRGADPSRIASQVVSGVSFLGAGVIFKHGSTIKGLTTAAGIWATAGIGLALGGGMYVMGIFATVVMLLLQVIMHRFLLNWVHMTFSHICFTLQSGEEFQDVLEEFLSKRHVQVSESVVTYEDDDCVTFDMVFHAPTEITLHEWHRLLEAHGKIRKINYTPVT